MAVLDVMQFYPSDTLYGWIYCGAGWISCNLIVTIYTLPRHRETGRGEKGASFS
jgi:hypothetical protein